MFQRMRRIFNKKAVSNSPVFTQQVTPPTPPVRQATKGIADLIKASVMVAIAIIAFDWLNSQTNLREKLDQVPTEGWLGTAVAVGVPLWQWKADREKEKIKLAQARAKVSADQFQNATDNIDRIKQQLETRIDSCLLQIASLRSNIARLEANIEELEEESRAISEKIDKLNYKALETRLEILQIVYEKFCTLSSSVSHARGVSEGSDRDDFARQLDLILQTCRKLQGGDDTT